MFIYGAAAEAGAADLMSPQEFPGWWYRRGVRLLSYGTTSLGAVQHLNVQIDTVVMFSLDNFSRIVTRPKLSKRAISCYVLPWVFGQTERDLRLSGVVLERICKPHRWQNDNAASGSRD